MATVRTVTVKPSGGNYVSLTAAEAGEQGNLVTLDRQLNIECYAKDDTAVTAVIDGSTTDATRFIHVYCPTSERHDGKWNDSKYRLRWTDGSYRTEVFRVADDYTIVTGLQVSLENTAYDNSECITIAASNVVIQECIVRKISARTNATGIFDASGPDGHVSIRNNIIYGFDGIGIFISDYRNPGGAGSAYIENNTVVGCGTGIHGGYTAGQSKATKVAYNNLCSGNVTAYSSSYWTTYGNNLSSDGTSPDVSFRNKIVTFVDAANKDYHLSAADTDARGQGSSSPSARFTADIDGQTRSAPWDIGADQYVAAGTTTYTEAVDALITAGISVADTTAMADALTVAAQAADSVADLATRAESLLSVAQAADSVAAIQTMLDALVTTAAAEPSVVDQLTNAGVENLQTTAAAVVTVQDAVVLLEQISAAASAVVTVTDQQTSALAENLTTAATAIASVSDLQLMVDNLTIMATSGASIGEIGAYLEQLVAAATGEASVSDILVGPLVAMARLRVTARDPLALLILARDPLALSIAARDPLLLNIVRTL